MLTTVAPSPTPGRVIITCHCLACQGRKADIPETADLAARDRETLRHNLIWLAHGPLARAMPYVAVH